MKDKNETHLYHCLQIGKLKKNLPLFFQGKFDPSIGEGLNAFFGG